MNSRVRQAELARMLGVSRQAIHKLVREGKISAGQDGLIDVAEARQAIAHSVHPGGKTAQALAAVQLVADEVGAIAAAEKTVKPPPQPTGIEVDGNGMPTSYHVARTLRETEEARMAKLRREEMEDALIRVTAVEMVWAGSLAAVREKLLQLSSRLAPMLAVESDPLKIEELLHLEHAQALELLAGCQMPRANAKVAA